MTSVDMKNMGENYNKARGKPYHTIARIDTFHCQQKEWNINEDKVYDMHIV